MNWIICTDMNGTEIALPEDGIASIYTVDTQDENGRAAQVVITLREGQHNGSPNVFVREAFATLLAQLRPAWVDMLSRLPDQLREAIESAIANSFGGPQSPG